MQGVHLAEGHSTVPSQGLLRSSGPCPNLQHHLGFASSAVSGVPSRLPACKSRSRIQPSVVTSSACISDNALQFETCFAVLEPSSYPDRCCQLNQLMGEGWRGPTPGVSISLTAQVTDRDANLGPEPSLTQPTPSLRCQRRSRALRFSAQADTWGVR